MSTAATEKIHIARKRTYCRKKITTDNEQDTCNIRRGDHSDIDI